MSDQDIYGLAAYQFQGGRATENEIGIDLPFIFLQASTMGCQDIGLVIDKKYASHSFPGNELPHEPCSLTRYRRLPEKPLPFCREFSASGRIGKPGLFPHLPARERV